MDDICTEAERRGVHILRDRNELAVGDSISEFMRRIGEGNRVFIVLSAKYLRSSFCMFELFEVWQNCGGRKKDFRTKACPFVLPDAMIDSIENRIKCARFWKQKYDDVKEMIDNGGQELIGTDDFVAFRQIREFYQKVGNILATIADIVQPRTLEQLMQYGFGDPRPVGDGVTGGEVRLAMTSAETDRLLADTASWADDAGTDTYGAWATFSVRGPDGGRVMQRLRWCPPGRLLMGSPRDEGPLHEVVFAQGFWIFETVCRQDLWETVMGNNPSQGRAPTIPVTCVSWEDAQRFVERLNAEKPGLAVDLPSEAQWAYAGRAETETANCFGPREGGNQVKVESPESMMGGSRPPNDWGIYGMDCNPVEWCADAWHDHIKDAPTDGSAFSNAGSADRIVRYRPWNPSVHNLREVVRERFAASFQSELVGFRCVRRRGD